MKKTIFSAICVSMLLLVGGGAKAATVEELQAQLGDLMNKINELTVQLNSSIPPVTLSAAPVVTATASCPSFSRNLTVGSTGEDVKCLQQMLNKDNDTKVAESGAGSPGNETTYFGEMTKNAVINFQKKNNISPQSGFFGPMTRDKANGLLSVAPSPSSSDQSTLNLKLSDSTLNTFTAGNNLAVMSLKASGEAVLKGLSLEMNSDPSLLKRIKIYCASDVVADIDNPLFTKENNSYYLDVNNFSCPILKDETKNMGVKVSTAKINTAKEFSIKIRKVKGSLAGQEFERPVEGERAIKLNPKSP